MKIILMAICLPLLSLAQSSAEYKVAPGSLHKKGNVFITVLPDEKVFKVKMDYKVKKKDLVPVSSSLLRGSKTFDFPNSFRTVAGYIDLQAKRSIEIPKAKINFVKRGDIGELKNAYFLEVLPTNKKSKIDIVYHPSLPSVGWQSIKITFISPFPILDGYELFAELVK
jgi:hypothetical protein